MASARYLLKYTELTVKEICFNTGFSSESVFCNAFKKQHGMTPQGYRLQDAEEKKRGPVITGQQVSLRGQYKSDIIGARETDILTGDRAEPGLPAPEPDRMGRKTR